MLKCWALGVPWWSHHLGMPHSSWAFSAFPGSITCRVLHCSSTQTAQGNKDTINCLVICCFLERLESKCGRETVPDLLFFGRDKNHGCRWEPLHPVPRSFHLCESNVCVSLALTGEGKCCSSSNTGMFRKDLHAVLSLLCLPSLKDFKLSDEWAADRSWR